jgi:hypothetical protein
VVVPRYYVTEIDGRTRVSLARSVGCISSNVKDGALYSAENAVVSAHSTRETLNRRIYLDRH